MPRNVGLLVQYLFLITKVGPTFATRSSLLQHSFHFNHFLLCRKEGFQGRRVANDEGRSAREPPAWTAQYPLECTEQSFGPYVCLLRRPALNAHLVDLHFGMRRACAIAKACLHTTSAFWCIQSWCRNNMKVDLLVISFALRFVRRGLRGARLERSYQRSMR